MNEVSIREILIETVRAILSELAERFGNFTAKVSDVYTFIKTLISKFLQGYNNVVGSSSI